MPAAPAVPAARTPVATLAMICGGVFVVANLMFYFVSGGYFESHREFVAGSGMVSTYAPGQMTHVRIEFAVFALVIAAAGFAAGRWPRAVGHVLPLVFSVFDVIAAIIVVSRGATGLFVLVAVLVISGGLLPPLVWYSLRERSRAAWAFLLTICAVFALVELFGAPKIRGALDIGFWITIILPGLQAIAVVALSLIRHDYAEGGAPADVPA